MEEKSLHDAGNVAATEPVAGASTATQGRRRWVAGAGAAVLLSLKAGGALAGGVCASPSGFKSINANPKTSSKPGNFDGTCNSHGYYKSQPTRMGAFRTAKLSDYGLIAPTSPDFNSNSTLETVVSLTGNAGSYSADARNLVTVLLDYLLGQQQLLGLQEVKDMWTICFGSASMLATSSRFYTWTKLEVEAYLVVYVGP